jgi:hypothetical protein
MAIRRTSVTGVGLGNRNIPVWDFGCRLYWQSNFGPGRGATSNIYGSRSCARGGYKDTHGGVVGGVGQTTYFDPGLGQFVVFYSTPAEVYQSPADGRFCPDRTNYWDNNTAAATTGVDPGRGFSMQPGLTCIKDAIGLRHIVQSNVVYGPTDVARIENTSGGALLIYRDDTTSATYTRWYTVLVKNVVGGVVDGSVVVPHVWTATDGYNWALSDIAVNTYYKQVRSDGWYEVGCSIPIMVGAPNRRIGLEIKDAARIYYEMPQWESVGVSFLEGTTRIRTAGASATPAWGIPPNAFYEDGGPLAFPACGWMAATVVPRWPVIGGGSKTYPAGVVMELASDAVGTSTDFHRLYWSATGQTLVYICTVGGVTQASLEVPQADILAGQPIGIVATWGQRDGTRYFQMASNGVFQEVDISGTVPGTALTDLYVSIGGVAGVNPISLPANSHVRVAAFGDQALHRSDVRALSKWFQKQSAVYPY